MNILYIGGIYSEHLIPQFQNLCKKGYQFASQALQESFIKGFLTNDETIKVLSCPSVPTFPLHYKSPVILPDTFTYESKKLGETIGRINLPIIKCDIHLKKQIDQWCRNIKGKKYVLIYSLQASFLKIAKYIKDNYLDVTIGIIVADLPQYMSWNKYYVLLGLKQHDESVIYNNLKYVDKYILLSKHMKDRLPIGEKPWIIIEGIFNSSYKEWDIINKKNTNAKVFLYTGNLDKRYGIMDLVVAFSSIPDKDIRLWICGFGDTVDEIKKYQNNDNRICYFGAVSHTRALQMQKEASFLVNPRHSKEEYTKYSFPSKTMEYLASGTPTIMCKLECIPPEYNDYLIYFDDETVDGYKNTLTRVLGMNQNSLLLLGSAAQKFIIETKNPMVQVKKVLDFLSN